MPEITEEHLDKLGKLVDTCENFLAYKGNRAMGIEMRHNAYEYVLEKVRDDLRALYLELGREDVWDG